MTYEECRLELEKILGVEVIVDENVSRIGFSTRCYGKFASMSTMSKYIVSTDFSSFYLKYDDDIRKEIIDVLYNLTNTDLEDREKKDKYYLRHKYLNDDVGSFGYLNIVLDKGYYVLDNNFEMQGYSVKFTLNDIEKLKKKLNTDLSEFDIVKVEN